MADPVVTPGSGTSEYLITKLVIIFGTLCTVVGAGLSALPPSVNVPYLPIVMVVVGAGAAFFKARGYTANRTALKVAAATSVAAKNAPEVISIVQQVLAAIAATDALKAKAIAAGAAAAHPAAGGAAAVAPANQ